jgi:hypothetical protein
MPNVDAPLDPSPDVELPKAPRRPRKDAEGVSMARVDILSTTDRAPGGRHAPTFSTVEAVHTGLIERLAGSKPRRILPIADAQDIEGRAEHLQQVVGAVLDYVGAIVTDMDHVAPGGSTHRKYLLGLISDVAGDVAGSITNAAGRGGERLVTAIMPAATRALVGGQS